MPIEVSGLNETLSAMRKFEPDLLKNLNKQMRAGMTPIQKKAQGYMPDNISGLRNWMLITKGKKINKATSAFATVGHFPKFNASIAKRGIKINTGKQKKNKAGFVIMYRISNLSRAGTIVEMAGRVNPGGSLKSKSNNPNAGEHFINSMQSNLKGKASMRGRVLYRAADEDQGRTIAVMMKALEQTIAEFKNRANTRAAFKVKP